MDKIDELLTRRVDSVYPSKGALEKVLCSGKKLRLYQGFDPTASKLHLGHTVGLRKLMEFANLGHEVIFLFGTGTVLVGDPSERDAGRKLITNKEIKENIKDWEKQTEAIVDFNKVKIMYNGDWLTKLTLKDIINIGSKVSAVQLFKRDNFTERIKKGDTVWYHETLYPLLQGYDSVVMDVDLEVGGTDQTFNMLIGRELQKKFNNKEKFVLTTKMIPGTDGKNMSKTSNNCIWLNEQPQDIYGKIMKVQDNLIMDYFEFFTQIPMTELASLQEKVDQKPMEIKNDLAFEITRQLHGEAEALRAQNYFKKKYQEKTEPDPEFLIHTAASSGGTVTEAILKSQGFEDSKSQLKRMFNQGGVSLNRQKVTDPKTKVSSGDIVSYGKHRDIKIK